MKAPQAFIRDLAAVGIAAESPWDLVNTSERYPAAIPLLIEWLGRAEEVPAHERSQFREGLVRSLAVREARGVAAKALVSEFHRPGVSRGYRWTVGMALEAVADDSVFDDLVTIARDKSYGTARKMVVLALGRTKNPNAAAVLVELLEDDEVAGHAVAALGKLKARDARVAIERLLEHGSPLVRKEAKKALARIGS